MSLKTTKWTKTNPNTTKWGNPSGWTRITYGSHPKLDGSVKYGGTYTPAGSSPPSFTKWSNP